MSVSVKMEEHTLFKFHVTYGESKKLVSSSVADLRTALELKFSVTDAFLVKLFLPEVEDYIEWDSECELMVASQPSSKIWKIVVEKPKSGDSGGGAGDARSGAANSYGYDGYPTDGRVDPATNSAPLPSTPPPTKLFVGNLDSTVTKDDLKKLFEAFGTVVECAKVRDFGFVHFKEKGEAQQAIKHLNNTEFRKKKIHVKVAITAFRQKPGMSDAACHICGDSAHRTAKCPRDPRARDDMDPRDPYARRTSPYDPRYYPDPYARYPPVAGGSAYSGRAPPPSHHGADRYRPYPAPDPRDPYRRAPEHPPAPRDPYTDPYYSRDYYGARQPPPRDPYASNYYAPRSTYGTSSQDADADASD